MCGGCGTGIATAPWEVELFGAARSTRRDIAKELTRQAGVQSGLRVEANSFGVGYVITTARGKRALTETLDATVDALDFEQVVDAASLSALGSQPHTEAAVMLSRLRLYAKGVRYRATLTTSRGDVDVTVTATGVSVHAPMAT